MWKMTFWMREFYDLADFCAHSVYREFSKLFLLVIYIQASVQRFFCRKQHCVFASLALVHNPDDISIRSGGLAEHVVVSDHLAALHATSLSGLCITQFSQSINAAVAYHRPRGRDRPYSWVLDARQAWLWPTRLCPSPPVIIVNWSVNWFACIHRIR